MRTIVMLDEQGGKNPIRRNQPDKKDIIRTEQQIKTRTMNQFQN